MTLDGNIKKQDNGSLDILFTPSSRPFTFDNGVVHGSFLFGITDGGITGMKWNGSPYELTGYISGASQSKDLSAVPEPGSIVLLSTALAAAIAIRRRAVK